MPITIYVMSPLFPVGRVIPDLRNPMASVGAHRKLVKLVAPRVRVDTRSRGIDAPADFSSRWAWPAELTSPGATLRMERGSFAGVKYSCGRRELFTSSVLYSVLLPLSQCHELLGLQSLRITQNGEAKGPAAWDR